MNEKPKDSPTLDEVIAALDVLLRYLRTMDADDFKDFCEALPEWRNPEVPPEELPEIADFLKETLDPNPPISGGRYA